ncbi:MULTISPECIES: DUF1292 domain-containing protein [unclassified Paenibacillus]|uniref:DUF1292 domain-containing protein n=1 Tax=unclassified Paenibacillus TaxID=185978 RepID=UPI000956FF33|nr:MULTISPECIES: DUF1292 domain-containing protein [unclassified Paenibacillus]ASS66277.1 DUF1292 domain-containing protein [Paenibacillus sp. RUD330]SIQ09341.1 Protein of unknown function [Paenibacillus sp. RU4X]SIQ29631.1 Protein of unknown function [Paenibacillus sp. RU4T]
MSISQPERITLLKETFGREVLLVDDSGQEIPYTVQAEFSLGDRSYAALQSPALRKEGEVEMFLIVLGVDGTPELETIEDDEEWELAAESYDALLFEGSDNEE